MNDSCMTTSFLPTWRHEVCLLKTRAAWAHESVMSVVASDSGRRNYKGFKIHFDIISQYRLVAEQDEGEIFSDNSFGKKEKFFVFYFVI
jgi:hypothetical protein